MALLHLRIPSINANPQLLQLRIPSIFNPNPGRCVLNIRPSYSELRFSIGGPRVPLKRFCICYSKQKDGSEEDRASPSPNIASMDASMLNDMRQVGDWTREMWNDLTREVGDMTMVLEDWIWRRLKGTPSISYIVAAVVVCCCSPELWFMYYYSLTAFMISSFTVCG